MSNSTNLSKEELKNLLREKLTNLGSLCHIFDTGRHQIASEIAVIIRVLFHETKKSKPLLKQCGLNHIQFLDTSKPDRQNLLPNYPLVHTKISSVGPDQSEVSHWPNLSPPIDNRSLVFTNRKKWWEESVIMSFPMTGFNHPRETWTRKSLVLQFANKLGGAHVDGNANTSIMKLERKDSRFVWVTSSGDFSVNGAEHYHTLRQIAFEITTSLKDQI